MRAHFLRMKRLKKLTNGTSERRFRAESDPTGLAGIERSGMVVRRDCEGQATDVGFRIGSTLLLPPLLSTYLIIAPEVLGPSPNKSASSARHGETCGE
jgi:hypothetical protein